MSQTLKSYFIIFILLTAALLGAAFAHRAEAQTSVEARRAQLEKELAGLEAEIEVQRKILESKKTERASLERDVAILNAKIQTSRLSIRARNIAIEKLSKDISGKTATISNLSKTLEKEKESLAELLRKTNELDSYSFAEVMLSNKDLSDFFIDLDSFETIKEAVRESYHKVESTKEETETQKNQLEEKHTDETELRKLQELEQKKIEREEAEKKKLVTQTKGLESEYQKILNNKEKTAAVIRTELFQLRGAAAIPFEKALQYANEASQKTGVRPAFILGILAEESNLGENVGTGIWTVDMHPTRDQPVFIELMKHLGLDPNKMPVSKKVWYGYGGAMGPAQFIPSTWVCFAGYINTSIGRCGPNSGSWAGPWVYDESKDRIGAAAGQRPPNPWEPRTAIIASALLLKDNGAAAGGFAAERLAALRYLAGWTNATKKEYAFYGDDVMELAEKYQKQIDILASVR